jgi:FMN phosphatase YigB (HAD superfamily)
MSDNFSVVGLDLDGTLYPITPEIQKRQRGNIYKKMSAHFGISVKEAGTLFEEYYLKLGSGSNALELIAGKLKKQIPKEDFIQEALEETDFLDLLEPNLALSQMLNRISVAKKLDLITSSRYDFALEKLRRIGIYKEIFENILAHEGSKTSGEVYRTWIAKRGLPPSQHLYVGDNKIQDINIPNALGIKTCFLGSYARAGFQIKGILDLEQIL